MARRKTVEERRDVAVPIRLIPMYGITFDDRNMTGITAVGRTPEEAMAKATGVIRTKYPSTGYNVKVIELNPGVFEKAGVHFNE